MVKIVGVQQARQSVTDRSNGAPAPTGPRGMTMGFLGAKGGVGTTTLAASVGALLAQDKDTILTDLRAGQGTLGVSMGFTRAQGLAKVMNRPATEVNAQVASQNIVQHNTGLKLLLSSVNPQENQITITPDSVSTLNRALSSLAHFRLYDLGAGLNRINVRLIRELDHTVVIVEPNRVTMMTAQAVLQEIDTLGVPSSKISLVIFNRTQSSLQIPVAGSRANAPS